MIKKMCIAFFLFGVLFYVCGNGFNLELLTDAEKKQFLSGGLVIRELNKKDKLSLVPSTPEVQLIVDEINSLAAVHRTEIFQLLSVTDTPNYIEQLRENLEDIDSYVHIPYYSTQNKATFMMYDKTAILSETQTGNQKKIEAMLEMNPFSPIHADITLTFSPNTLQYRMKNLNVISYNGISSIKKEQLHSVIYAEQIGDLVLLYGFGSLNIPFIPFAQERIKIAFMNRIKDFAVFMMQNQ